MTNHHHIALIGGTGKSGKYLTKKLLKEGFSIKMLLRNPDRLELHHPAIDKIKGDARNPEDIERLLQGCTAVLSTLGQPKGEPPIFSTATNNVLHAMNKLQITRYIVTTGLSVDVPNDYKSEKVQQASDWMRVSYAPTTNDKQLEYEILAQCSVDWTLVRLPLIEQTEITKGIKVDLGNCPGDQVSAADLANFIVEQLQSEAYIRKAPFIASI
ncbi:NAD(P)-dependent oxidoreductase [Nubsella zeaxanthinifaciens]|uniref:NAD(P)-dependent oxidoreductase n=1 Tax=Nubsella zeaxanthinifaciens TaxID=392412 RepID=UPI003D026514